LDTESFGARLRLAMDELGPLCAGIDPHPALLARWGLPDSVQGLETFAMTCVEAFAGSVAVVKPQSAFFERLGSGGVAVLERALAGLREAGTLSLLDVKRGDIGSTMAAYADAYHENGRGIFVLALTSNPEGAEVQHAYSPKSQTSATGQDSERSQGRTVAGSIVDGVTNENAIHDADPGAHVLGSVGMVIGATVGEAVRRLGLDLASANAPLLAPGVGAQGATSDDLRTVFGAALDNVLASSSREILAAGPDGASLRAAARHTARELRVILGR